MGAIGTVRVGSAHCVREPREPDAGPGKLQAARDGIAPHPGCIAKPVNSPVACGELIACCTGDRDRRGIGSNPKPRAGGILELSRAAHLCGTDARLARAWVCC